MAPPEKYQREDIINAVWQHRGIVTAVAQALGTTTKTIYEYADRYKTVQDAINGARGLYDNDLLDRAELALLSAVTEKRAWAVQYALKMKGRDRGYVERHDFDHTSKGEQISPNIFLPAVSHVSTDDSGD